MSVKRHPKPRRRVSAHTAVAMLECWWGPIREVEALREVAGSEDDGGGASSTSNVSWRADEVATASLPSVGVLSELLIE